LADFRQRSAAARLKHGWVIEKSGSPLRNGTFRRVWIGATVSAAGDAASWVGLVAYALGLAGGSAASMTTWAQTLRITVAPAGVHGPCSLAFARDLAAGGARQRAADHGTVEPGAAGAREHA